MKRLVFLIVCAAFGWFMGGWLFAAEPDVAGSPQSLANLQEAAHKACEKRGYTLQSILIRYNTVGVPVSASVGCGEPRRSQA